MYAMHSTESTGWFARSRFTRWVLALALVATFLLPWAAEGAQQTRYVRCAPTALGNGSSWATAQTNIWDALTNAYAQDAIGPWIIWVSNGVYEATNEIVVNAGTHIIGTNVSGFAAAQTGVHVVAKGAWRTFNLQAPTAKILWMTISNKNVGIGGGVHVAAGVVSNCIISKCAWTNGGGVYLDGAGSFMFGGFVTSCVAIDPSFGKGGGVYVANGATVSNVLIRNCLATNDGGGLFVSNGWVYGGTVLSNRSIFGSGGGAFVAAVESGSGGMVTGTIFQLNIATNGRGGGVYAEGGNLRMLQVGGTALGNTAMDGGGLYISNVASFLVGAPLLPVQANVATRDGGGMYIRMEDAVLTNWNISGNTASNGGGGLFLYTNAFVYNGGSSGNTARVFGGGVYQNGGLITNFVAEKNFSTNGVGIYMQAGTVAGSQIRFNNNLFPGPVANPSLGGGVYIFTGSLSNSVVLGNTATNGAGVYLATEFAQVYGLTVLSNRAGRAGGGIYAATSTVYNSLIAANVASNGGGVFLTGAGSLRSCTIAGNTATNGGGLYCSTGEVVNTIIYYNNMGSGYNVYDLGYGYGLSPDLTNVVAVPADNTYTYTCARDVPAGVGNRADDPLFVARQFGDYQLRADSTCLDTGLDEAWMTGAYDVRGGSRTNGTVDLGAYENGGDLGGPLSVGMIGTNAIGNQLVTWLNPTSGLVFFHANVAGSNTASVTYYWDFDTNGTPDAIGDSVSQWYTNDLWAGSNSVRVTAVNGIGEIASRVFTNYIFVAKYFVVPVNPYARHPYHSWATAATSLVDAVAAAVPDGATINVGDGVHNIGASVAVNKGALIRSVNGAARTLVKAPVGATYRCFLVTHSNAVIDGLTVSNGWAAAASLLGNGGGVFLVTGLVQNCRIVNNTATNQGGGVYVCTNGILRNSLIYGNVATNGGGVFLTVSGLVQSCTIVSNRAMRTGGGLYSITGRVDNTIIYNNSTNNLRITPASPGGGRGGGDVTNVLYTGVGGGYTNCCTPLAAALPGPDNQSGDPLFLNPANADFRLGAGSSCTGNGLTLPWMTGRKDLGGVNDRVMGASVDIGAYEGGGALQCGFIGTNALGNQTVNWLSPTSSTMFFSGYIDGIDVSSPTYEWDFNDDGSIDATGQSVVWYWTNDVGGYFSVKLIASNGGGEVATNIAPNYVFVSRYYVAPANAAPSFPYQTWATAATNLQDAVIAADWAGAEVRLAAGPHSLSNQVILNKPIWIHGVSGADRTLLFGRGATYQHRCLYVVHTNAMVDGLTISNGLAHALGGANLPWGIGGGILLVSGVVQNCHIVNNVATNLGGGVYVCTNGILRNSLVYGNVATNGGGVYLTVTGLVQSCTIVSNLAFRAGGGLYSITGRVDNTIIFLNRTNGVLTGTDLAVGPDVTNIIRAAVGGGFSNCFTRNTSALTGSGNITGAPDFANPTNRDYRLRAASACIDAGTNQSWMIGATDLGGQVPRIVPNAAGTDFDVDIGAYESGPLQAGFTVTNALGNQLAIWSSPTSSVMFFTGYGVGTNTSGLTYTWDFNNDGAADANTAIATYDFKDGEGGYRPVRLTISNSIAPTPETATVILSSVFVAKHFVAQVNPNPVAPYYTWATAATNIQDALSYVLPNGSQIVISNGTYNVLSQLAVTNGTWIRSVNGAGETFARSRYPAITNRVVYMSHSNAVVQGLTITNGADGLGGGILIFIGRVDTCVIAGNFATNGGGVYLAGHAIVRNSTVAGNQAWASGGGMYCTNWGGVTNVVIDGNSAGALGGGVYVGLAPYTAFNSQTNRMDLCTIQNNHADGFGGGGAYLMGGTLTNCTIQNNWVTNAGGGVFAGAPSVRVATGSILDNTALYGGGFYATNWGALDFVTIAGNTASNGGGVFSLGQAHGATLPGGGLYGCTISGNVARTGGGAYLERVRATNCTVIANVATNGGGVYLTTNAWWVSGVITGNWAALNGGGMFLTNQPIAGGVTMLLTVSNALVVGNEADDGGGIYCDSTGLYGQVHSSIIGGNTSRYDGAGVYMRGGWFTNCTFRYNSAAGAGGGVFAAGCGVIYNCTNTQNYAFNGGGIAVITNLACTYGRIDWNHAANYGGGVYCTNFGFVTTVAIANNEATVDGGGLYGDKGLIPRTCFVASNTAYGNGGGGFFGDDATTNYIFQCTFYSNWCNGLGGGVYLGAASAYNCAAVSNSAPSAGGIYMPGASKWVQGGVTGNFAFAAFGQGGGVYMQGGLFAPNGSVTGNVANQGGGVYLEGGVLSNCTIIGNTALAKGGGVFMAGGVLTNLMILRNVAQDGGGLYVGDTLQYGGTQSQVRIMENMASRYGGGIYANMLPFLAWFDASSLVSSNVAGESGGGVYVDGALGLEGQGLAFSNSVMIQRNIATNSGGGVYATGQSYLDGWSVLTNMSRDSGGGIYLASALSSASMCRVVGNSATNKGGGLYLLDGAVTGGWFALNNATNGGGIYIVGGTLSGGTSVQNTAQSGAGLCVDGGGLVAGTLITNNVAQEGAGLFVTNVSAELFVDGLRIHFNTATNRGGGVYLPAGVDGAHLQNSDIRGNRAVLGDGGGVYQAGGHITDCTIMTNLSSAGKGGGLYRADWTGTLANVTIAQNIAVMGGGVSVTNSTLLGVTVLSNRATQVGGGVLSDSDAVIVDCVAYTNVATFRGGGVFMLGGAMTNCMVYGNVAPNGGGIYLSSTVARVDGGIIASNLATTGNGGGIYAVAGTVTNSLVQTNIAFNGGGVYVYSAAAVVGSLTITDNMARINGGGLYVATGTVDSCLIAGNLATNFGGGAHLVSGNLRYSDVNANISSNRGGGVYLGIALLENSSVANNVAVNGGGGVYCATGQVWSSRITGNQTLMPAARGGGILLEGTGAVYNAIVDHNASTNGGGVYVSTGGRLLNSTVVDNWSTNGGVHNAGGLVANTIMFYNRGSVSTPLINNWNVSGGTALYSFSNCCSYPAATGQATRVSGNISSAPLLMSDYSPSPASPCMDAGVNQEWMLGAFDYVGRQRIDGDIEIVDIGPFEGAYGSDLAVNIVVDKTAGSIDMDRNRFQFTATVSGADTNGITYVWDFDNDGTADFSGPDRQVVTNVYTASGSYDVKVTVTNAALASASNLWSGEISIATYYVVADYNSAGTYPYTSWGTAASNLVTVLQAAPDGTTVIVSNGLYMNFVGAITVDRSLYIWATNGPYSTEITNVAIYASGTTLDGFKISGRRATLGALSQAVDIHAENATLKNCFLERADRYVMVEAGLGRNFRMENCIGRFAYTNGVQVNANTGVRIVSNMFQRFAFTTDGVDDFVAEYNLIIGRSVDGRLTRPVEFTNVTGTVEVRNNNFIYQTNTPVMSYFGGTLDVVATNNWWGTANGPRDEVGTVEMAAADPDAATADMKNDTPGDTLGGTVAGLAGGVTNYFGSDNIDYHPWATTPFASPFPLPPGKVYVDETWYGPAQLNEGHTWMIDAWTNLQQAVNSNMFWDGGCEGVIRLHIPQLHSTIEGALAEVNASVWPAEVTYEVFVTNMVYPAAGPAYEYSTTEWTPTRRGTTLIGRPVTNITLAGGWSFAAPFFTLDGFNCVTGGPSYFLRPAVTNVTLKNCRFTRSNKRTFESSSGCHQFRSENCYYDGSTAGNYINPGMNNCQWVSNYFDGLGIGFDLSDNIQFYYNTFVRSSVSISTYDAGNSIMQNPAPVFRATIMHNNFFGHNAGDTGIQIPSYHCYGGVPLIPTNVQDRIYVVAVSNYWASTNGPCDEFGVTEVDIMDVYANNPGPGMTNLLNASPIRDTFDIGASARGVIYSNGSNLAMADGVMIGSSNIDYYPWSVVTFTNGWPQTFSPNVVFVNTNYYSDGPHLDPSGSPEIFPTLWNGQAVSYEWGVNAFSNIQTAVDLVFQGNGYVYLATQRFDIATPITLSGRVHLMGSASWTGGWSTIHMDYPNAIGRCINIANSFATLQYLTITNGHALGAGQAGQGGGVRFAAIPSTPNQGYPIRYCQILGNVAEGAGGGVYFESGGSAYGPRLQSSTISGNKAWEGGGIYSVKSIFPTACVIENNAATNGNGGGIFCGSGLASAAYGLNAIIRNNTATGDGGGVYSSNNTHIAWTISGNSAASNGGGAFLYAGGLQSSVVDGNTAGIAGGGVFGQTNGPAVTMNSATVMCNSAVSGGGVSGWLITLQNLTQIYSNTAAVSGGGVYASNLTASAGVRICTNVAAAGSGGGVYASIGTLTAVTNIGNYAAQTGGAVFVDRTLTMTNCDMIENTSSNGGGAFDGMALTISGGNYLRNVSRGSGGGVSTLSTNMTISGATFENNAAESHGGGLYAMNDCAMTSRVLNCQFIENVAQTNGGGLWLFRGAVAGNTFAGNTATNSGGGAYVWAGGVTNCSFLANFATNQGAGLYYNAQSLINNTGTISSCAFSANVGLGDGAGAYVVTGVVQGCSFADNVTAGRGGGAYLLDTIVTNALASGNTAGDGGGLYIIGTDCVLTNCTLSANVANTNGGGILIAGGAIARGCVVKGNTAGGIGGGVYMESGSNENFTIYANTADIGSGVGQLDGVTRNALLKGNVTTLAGDQTNWYVLAGTVESSFGPVKAETAGWGSGNLGEDVEGDSAMLDAPNGNFRLLASSPCADVGLNQAWMTVAKDISGANRIIDTTVDMGAYEGTYAVRTLYVSPDGSSTPPYTNWADAGANLATVLSAADVGDTVMLTNGTYSLASVYTISKSITLKSTNGCDSTAILAAGGLVVGASGVKIEGLRIAGYTPSNTVKGKLAQVITVNSGIENVMLRSNIIENADRWVYAAGANRLIFDANVFRYAWYRGLDLSGGRHTVTRNLFQKHGISGSSLSGLTAEWNLFLGSETPGVNARMLEFDNVTAQLIVRNNNIMFNDDVGILYGVGSAEILATNNWWGTDNGPRDESGSTEMAPLDADTATANLKNALPAEALGPIVAEPDPAQTGSSSIDYFPWASAPLALPPMITTMPSNQVWVSWSNQVFATWSPTPAYGTAFGVDAFSNIGDAVNAHMYWDGGCRMEYLLHVPEQYPYTNIQDGLNGAIRMNATNGLNIYSTLIVHTNVLGDGSYSKIGGGAWDITKGGVSIVAQPTTQVVARGSFQFNAAGLTLNGFIVENGAPNGIVFNTGASGQNLIRDCRFRNVAGSILISFSGGGGGYRGTFDFMHNYIESGGGIVLQPGWWNSRIMSNYFGQGTVNLTDQEGVHVEYNTFDNGCQMGVSTYNPMSTSRSTWTNYVCNNNFVGLTADDAALTVDWYNNTGPYDLSYGILAVIATNNWWGNPNGPYDPRGDVGGSEVDVTSWSPLTFTPHPGVRGLSNSVPASPDIGAAIYRRSRAPNTPAEPGADNVDYLPWATNFVTTFNDWGTNSSAREAWVDTAYRAPFYGGSNGNWFPGSQEYRWGYNAFSNLDDACRSVNQSAGTVWVSPEDRHQLESELIISGVITVIGTNGSGNAGRALVTMKAGVNQRCIQINNSLASLRYLVISNGYAAGSGTDGCGGGVYINRTGGYPGSYPNTPWYLLECEVVSNRAAVNGGGVYISSVAGNSPRFYNTLIARNQAGVSGGGVYSERAVWPLSCTIEDNVALTGDGGGIYTVGGEALVNDWRPYGTNALVQNNTAAGCGGGVYAYSNFSRYWTIVGNTAQSADGGGAYVRDGSISNWTVRGNSAVTNGGGLYLAGVDAGQIDIANNTARNGAGLAASNATLQALTITNNVATTNGGALYAINGLSLVNSLLSNNVAGAGGAIYADTDPTVATMALTITNTLITMNWATNGDGGGICAAYSTLPASYRLTLRDSPVVWNWASNGMGGGVSAASNVTAIGASISSNFAGMSGGGLYLGGSLMMSNVSVVANQSTNGQGGGVWVGVNAGVSNSWLVGNFSRLDGGGLYAGGGATLRATPVVNNTATNGSGGGVYAGEDFLATSLSIATNYAGVAAGGAYAGGDAGLTSVRVANNVATNGSGGGMYVAGAAGLTNSVVVNNQSTSHGGGVYAGNGGWLFTTPVSANSAAGGAGGGVYAAAGQFLARDLGMTNNVAAGSGGGAWVASGGMTNMTFTLNRSHDSGGGLYMLGGGITNLTFTGNIASNSGGGLYGESLNVSWRCEFLGNSAGTNGGGAWLQDSVVATGNIKRALSSVVSNNAAVDGSGGGLYVARTFVGHVLMQGNTAKYLGGGAFMTNGSLLRNAVVFSNRATFVSSEGGGLYMTDSTNESCTISGNSAASGGGVVMNDASRTLNSVVFYNTVGNWLRNAGTVDYSCSPDDMSLWGGNNKTVTSPYFINPAAGDFRLATNASVCINNGQTQPWMNGIYDILGSNRVQGAAVDIGANEGGVYMYVPSSSAPGTIWRIW